MGKVCTHMTMSLDGFIADSDDQPGERQHLQCELGRAEQKQPPREGDQADRHQGLRVQPDVPGAPDRS